MSEINIEVLKKAIAASWSQEVGYKVGRYVDKFFECSITGSKIMAKVRGTRGIYRVSIEVKEEKAHADCSCYIGGGGGCHHCHALAVTFLIGTQSFLEAKPGESLPPKDVMIESKKIKKLSDLEDYLESITLDSLIKQLKTKGFTQKALAESMGMNPRHLASIKSCELRNSYYNELGATKLACLWVLEHITEK
jgi:hypothetical protein